LPLFHTSQLPVEGLLAFGHLADFQIDDLIPDHIQQDNKLLWLHWQWASAKRLSAVPFMANSAAFLILVPNLEHAPMRRNITN
jgi:hypothetical protein